MSCAPSSIQWYIDQSDGLPVLVGHPDVCFFFCPPLVLRTSTGHSFRAIAMKLCRHITLGGYRNRPKILGVRPPWGNFFPNFFFRDIDLKICLSHAPDPGKNKQKKFGGRTPLGSGRSLNGARMTFFEFSQHVYRPQFQAIDTKFFRRIALLLE